MEGETVVIICADQPLTTHQAIVEQYNAAYQRIVRQAPRFKKMDLVAVQEAVAQNMMASQFRMNDEIMGLLDLMNYVRNGRQRAVLTAENAHRHFTLANMATLNGYYLFDFLSQTGYRPVLIQNFALDRERLNSLLRSEPLAVCISTTLINLDSAKEMALLVKELDPKIPVIIGGAGAKKTLDRGEGINAQTRGWIEGFRGAVDAFVIEAQGEWTLLKVLGSLKGEKDFQEIPNLAFFQDGNGLVFTAREMEPIDMDRGIVHWGRIPEAYLRKTLPVQTSKGCRYRCRFCTYWRLVPGVHHKSVEAMRQELRGLEALGTVEHVEIIDENFTSDPKRMDDTLKMMIEEDFSFTWSSLVRCDTITRERARLMRASGCVLVEMGLESGDQGMLDRMGKQTKVEQMKEAVTVLNEAGIDSIGFFIIGYPGETDETIEKTIYFIETTGLPYYQFMLFAFSSSMLIAKDKERYGVYGLAKAWKHNTMDAVTASGYFKKLFSEIKHSLTDGQMSTRETFKLLRGEGYSSDQIKKLFKVSNSLNQLRLEMGEKPEDDPSWRSSLDEMERVISGGHRLFGGHIRSCY